MPSGVFSAAIQAVKSQLEDLGYYVVTDPRNARPMSVLIELPTWESFTYNVADIRLQVRILAAPPGNQDASDWLITQADQIMDSPIAVTSGRPGFATYGGQDTPTYDLTVAVSVRRD